ncbi:PREDICTED: phosphoglycerate mutase-like protein isoform X4 [Brassica oleracea var. oleracea]|uniref:phosphoglycerate mutase-like protein isoform X4 n=1 Tax=Brassica oleracea var. oleracea TaxID=109376 RepID=UPI0006A6D156|nr:PREDICTED: phosphoglycerate mutase-like protein isoform X4 [Brassica oleracea var. oleracea]
MELCGVQTLRFSSPNFKTLRLVRHAQGIHNVAIEKGELTALSGKLFDARLSQTGIQQVSNMRKEISKSGLLNTVQLVITSPLRRAMQTSVGIFRGQEDTNQSDIFPKVNHSPPIVALEICRERMGLYPCDKRESIGTYRTCFSEVDFTMRVMKILYGKQRRGKTWKMFLLEAFTFSNGYGRGRRKTLQLLAMGYFCNKHYVRCMKKLAHLLKIITLKGLPIVNYGQFGSRRVQ